MSFEDYKLPPSEYLTNQHSEETFGPVAFYEISAHIGPGSCFLCGRRLSKKHETVEHIFPKWLQNKFKLWQQKLTLLNGTSIPYRQLTVPCCSLCNTKFLSPFERFIKDALLKGVDGLEVVNSTPGLYLWLVKIFVGILYKEITIAKERSDVSKGPIVAPSILAEYRTLNVILQAARFGVVFEPDLPGSVFVFEVHDDNIETARQYDFCDVLPFPSICLQLGNVGVIAFLMDGGYIREYMGWYFDQFKGIRLTKFQLFELFSRGIYELSLVCTVPRFISVNTKEERWRFVSGLTWDSISGFVEVSERDEIALAQMVAYFTKMSVFDLLDEEGQRLTSLFNADGHIVEFREGIPVAVKEMVDMHTFYEKGEISYDKLIRARVRFSEDMGFDEVHKGYLGKMLHIAKLRRDLGLDKV